MTDTTEAKRIALATIPPEAVEAAARADYEMTRLRAENERLRAALRDMLRLVEDDEDDPAPYLIDVVCDRARAALAAHPTGDRT